MLIGGGVDGLTLHKNSTELSDSVLRRLTGVEVTKSLGCFGRKSELEQLMFSSEYLDSFEIHDSPFTCALDISGKLVTIKNL